MSVLSSIHSHTCALPLHTPWRGSTFCLRAGLLKQVPNTFRLEIQATTRDCTISPLEIPPSLPRLIKKLQETNEITQHFHYTRDIIFSWKFNNYAYFNNSRCDKLHEPVTRAYVFRFFFIKFHVRTFLSLAIVRNDKIFNFRKNNCRREKNIYIYINAPSLISEGQ